jgi:hypothetical protein
MSGTPISTLNVGTSTIGQASGRLAIGGGALSATDVLVGRSSGGSAHGTLDLRQTTFTANNLLAGGDGGSAELRFQESTASIADELLRSAGVMTLERSLIGVCNLLTLGAGSTLHVDIDGLARGTEYGAIDALLAELGGLLEVDFSDLAFSGPDAVFDLVRSGSSDGIHGDFGGFAFSAINGYLVSGGIELDGGSEIYRVRLMRAPGTVPEPGVLPLTLLAGFALLIARRRRPVR